MMLGHIRLHKLTEEHVSAWAMWSLQHGRLHGRKAGGPLSVTSVDMSLARLKEALERAKTRRMVAVNVASELHVRPKARKAERKRKEDVVPWTPGEVQVFVAAARDHEHRRFFAPLLLSLMGLRPAEVCGLGWKDVDLEAATLNVANTRTLSGNRTIHEKDAKSLAGNVCFLSR